MDSKIKIREAADRGRATQIKAARDRYKRNQKFCLFCKIEIPYEKRNNKFCNYSCSASFHNRKRPIYKEHRQCEYCQKNLPKYIYNRWCSKKCRRQYNYEEFVKSWKQGLASGVSSNGNVCPHLRRYLISIKGPQCWECGWNKINPYSNKVPIEVDHIDGDCFNNTESNLRILCPNCHSLTSTYHALNKGSGRSYRRKNDPIV